MVQIYLIANQYHRRHFTTLKRFDNELVPIVNVLEWLLIGNIIGKNYCIRLKNVGLDHLTEDTLTTNVPDLKSYIDIFRKLHSLNKEINPDSLFVATAELIFAKTHN